jgi:hypothetical protein
MWDYDQRFKILLDRLTFQIQDVQHREWFIAGLLPHIQVPLTQQKVTTQVEAWRLQCTWRLHQEGQRHRQGLAQVQSQLANLTMQLQDMAKEKVMHEHVWCTTCRFEGHHRG